MNPALGSEVRDVATAHVQDFVDYMSNVESVAVAPPRVSGDVRRAYVVAFIAELMLAERITMSRLREGLREGQR